MPNPADYKTKEEFLKVCIPAMVTEGKAQDQAVAACGAIWEQKSALNTDPVEVKQKSKIEILADMKRLMEKNGYTVPEEKLLEFYSILSSTNKLNHRFALSYIPVPTEENVYEIKVFPRKKVYIEHEKKYIDLNSRLFSQIIQNFKNEKLFKPFIDEMHKLGQKFGDVLEIYEKTNGLYARVKFNDDGIEAVKSNRFSYISPEWGDRIDTEMTLHKNVLWAITLTNIPALEGENPTLQSQIRLQKNIIGGKRMNYRERLSKFEGALSNYKFEGEAGMMPDVVAEVLATLKDAIAKIEELTGQKEMAEKTATEVQDKLNKIETEKYEAERAAFFEKAVSDGQIEPKEVEDWKEQYKLSKDFVVKIIGMRPKKSSLQKSVIATKEIDNTKLQKHDEAIMEEYGYKLPDGSYDVERYNKEILGGK